MKTKEDFNSTTCRAVVSFIMGVHQCKNLHNLEKSIQSIINQSFQQWELLVVDDGSEDNERTFDILQHYSQIDSRIKAFRYERNRGLAYALDYCLYRAKGKYIARQDDDDYSDPRRLKIQIDFLKKHQDIAICGTNATLFDEKGEWGFLHMPPQPQAHDFLWNSPFIHPSVVMRADALRSVGGYRVSRDTLLNEDYDLFMRMYARGFRGVNLQKSLYFYRSDRSVMKYRSLDARIREMRIRSQGFSALQLGPSRFIYILKPLVVGLIPRHLYAKLQSRRFTS